MTKPFKRAFSPAALIVGRRRRDRLVTPENIVCLHHQPAHFQRDALHTKILQFIRRIRPRHGPAITGLSYKAIHFGPVPVRWDRVYSLIDEVSLIEIEVNNGYVGNKLVSEMPCDTSCFTDEQLAVIERVYETFKNDSTASISKKSHEETAWTENQGTRSPIDFKYAFTLNAV